MALSSPALVPERPLWRKRWPTSLESAIRIEKLQLSGRPDRAIVLDIFRIYEVEDKPEHWQRLTAAYLRNLPTFLASHNGRILPGIENLLNELRRRHVPLGLLTGNIRAGAKAKLGHFGLHEYFAFGGFGDHHL